MTFSDGTTALATVPLDGGRARLTTSGLRPGSHAITATYSGDPGFTPGATDGPTDLRVGFSRPCITTAHHGVLTVPADQAICIGSGGSQEGKVTVQAGGSLAVSDARITGALALTVCRSTLTGPLTVEHSTGYVRIGGDTTACAGNVVPNAGVASSDSRPTPAASGPSATR